MCLREMETGTSCRGSVEMNPVSIHEDPGFNPCLAQWVKDPAAPPRCARPPGWEEWETATLTQPMDTVPSKKQNGCVSTSRHLIYETL